MKWNDVKRYLDISMPGCVNNGLHQFNHANKKKTQHQPYPSLESTYGAYAQNTKTIDTSPVLSADQVKKIAIVVGKIIVLHTWCGHHVPIIVKFHGVKN